MLEGKRSFLKTKRRKRPECHLVEILPRYCEWPSEGKRQCVIFALILVAWPHGPSHGTRANPGKAAPAHLEPLTGLDWKTNLTEWIWVQMSLFNSNMLLLLPEWHLPDRRISQFRDSLCSWVCSFKKSCRIHFRQIYGFLLNCAGFQMSWFELGWNMCIPLASSRNGQSEFQVLWKSHSYLSCVNLPT